MKKYIYLSILPVLMMMSFPFLASAQGVINIDNPSANLNDDPALIGRTLNSIINIIVAIVIVIAVVMLLYAGYLYVAKADQEDERKKANDIILYSAIGLIIVFLAKAIVAFVLNLIAR